MKENQLSSSCILHRENADNSKNTSQCPDSPRLRVHPRTGAFRTAGSQRARSLLGTPRDLDIVAAVRSTSQDCSDRPRGRFAIYRCYGRCGARRSGGPAEDAVFVDGGSHVVTQGSGHDGGGERISRWSCGQAANLEKQVLAARMNAWR